MTPRPRSGVRERIVEAAQRSFHERGYHGTSVDEVLARAGATKGAWYHHFGDKDELCAAVVDEGLIAYIEGRWSRTDWHADPVTWLSERVRTLDGEFLDVGCPVGALAQEVSNRHPELRTRLARVFDRWIERVADGLRAGQRNGTVRPELDVEQAAAFLVVWMQGMLSMTKVTRRGRAFVDLVAPPILTWLETLRAPR